MVLKERKKIKNLLPKFYIGTEPWNDDVYSRGQNLAPLNVQQPSIYKDINRFVIDPPRAQYKRYFNWMDKPFNIVQPYNFDNTTELSEGSIMLRANKIKDPSQFAANIYLPKYSIQKPLNTVQEQKPIGSVFQDGYNDKVADVMQADKNIPTKSTSPGTSESAISNNQNIGVGQYAQMATTVGSHIINSWNFANSYHRADELDKEAGRQQRYKFGVAYDYQNTNTGESSKAYVKQGLLNAFKQAGEGAAAFAPLGGIGAAAGAAGGLIAGLVGLGIGSKKQREERRKQKYGALGKNMFNESRAGTMGLMNDYFNEYGNTQGGVLYV